MDTLIVEILKLGVGGKQDSKNMLSVEQMKIVDDEGKLKVVYPSRVDISTERVSIVRD